jgi:hypothetical protein
LPAPGRVSLVRISLELGLVFVKLELGLVFVKLELELVLVALQPNRAAASVSTITATTIAAMMRAVFGLLITLPPAAAC